MAAFASVWIQTRQQNARLCNAEFILQILNQYVDGAAQTVKINLLGNLRQW